MASDVPFGDDDADDISTERLLAWLQASCDAELKLTAAYTVGDLIADLETIEAIRFVNGFDRAD